MSGTDSGAALALEPTRAVTAAEDDDLDTVLEHGRQVFGSNMELAERYAALLQGRAAEWGLVGPREGRRVWSRHLLNSAALGPLVPEDAAVADVGSGAGLPGIPLALARPDLRVTLIESLERRARFLRLAADELGLTERVDVRHCRAEQVAQTFDVVVSRAVAPLPTLIPWCLRLTKPSGEVLAMRGSRIDEELGGYLAAHPSMRRRVTTAAVPQAGAAAPVRVVRVSA